MCAPARPSSVYKKQPIPSSFHQASSALRMSQLYFHSDNISIVPDERTIQVNPPSVKNFYIIASTTTRVTSPRTRNYSKKDDSKIPVAAIHTRRRHTLKAVMDAPTKKRKRVSFAPPPPELTSVSFPNDNNDDKTRAELWYDSKSIRHMRIEALSAIAMSMMGLPDVDLRGLEPYLPQAPREEEDEAVLQQQTNSHTKERYVTELRRGRQGEESVATILTGDTRTSLTLAVLDIMSTNSRRHRAVEYCRNAVLDEQVEQWAISGEVNAERLAQVSRQTSISSSIRAIESALKDQEEMTRNE